MPAVLRQLLPLLHAEEKSVTGATIGEIADRARILDPEVIRPLDRPVHAEGSYAVLHGNLAPEGCCVKQTGVEPAMLQAHGPGQSLRRRG